MVVNRSSLTHHTASMIKFSPTRTGGKKGGNFPQTKLIQISNKRRVEDYVQCKHTLIYVCTHTHAHTFLHICTFFQLTYSSFFDGRIPPKVFDAFGFLIGPLGSGFQNHFATWFLQIPLLGFSHCYIKFEASYLNTERLPILCSCTNRS